MRGDARRLASLRLEEWARGDSYLHRRDARAKIAGLLIFLVAVSTTPPSSPGTYLPVVLVFAAGLAISGLPLPQVAARAAVILPFPLLFGFVSWLESGNATFAAALIVRSYVSALAVVLLMGVTPLPELLHGFRGLGAPALLVMVLQSIVRYLQLVVDHGLRMRRAAACRDAGGLPARNRPSLWRRSSGALAVLFGRSYERAEGVHRAMVARGFRGDFLAPRPSRFQWQDGVFVAGCTLAAVGARLCMRVLS